jgi:transposase
MSAAASLEAAAPAPRKRKYAAHSDDVRALVLRMRERGDSWARIEQETHVAHTTARHWVQLQQAESRAVKKPRGGSHHAVYSAAVREHVASVQEHDAALRISDLAQSAQRVFHTTPSRSTLHRMLHAADFTTKRMQPYANQRNTPETKEKRKRWVQQEAHKLTADNAVFIDETPFSMTLMRGRGRSRKGQPALGVVPAIRGKNHSVIAAISPARGLLHYAIKVTEPEEEFISKRSNKKKKGKPVGVNRDVVRSFLVALFATPAFTAARTPFLLVFDNARIHKGDIADAIFQAGHEQLFLPPWSPELNPIEYAFSKWKLAYRALYPASEDAVDPAIRQSSACLTPADCLHYFQHTQSLYPACAAMEDL